MTSGANIVLAVIGLVLVGAVVGALYLGFYLAGKKRDQPNYVLRGLFWSALFFFGGFMLLGAFAFGACLFVISGFGR